MNQIKKSLLTLISVALVIRSAGNIFQPALAYLADDLGITQVEATTNLTLYYFCLTISFLIFGPICDRYSKNRLLQLSLLGCLFGCILCGAATEILIFNIGRCIQAFSAGLALLCSQIWIADQPDKKSMMKRLAWFSIIVSIAPILSPVIGGFISDWFTWRYDFWFILILSLLGLFITIIYPLQESKSVENNIKKSPGAILKNYWQVLRTIPILSLTFCVQILFLGQSVFATLSSFLFIDEFGINASQLGVISGCLVLSMVFGRFPILYLSKNCSVKIVFLFCEFLVFLSCAIAMVYYFIQGTHNMYEVIVLLVIQAIGFSGLGILSTNNIMLVGGEQKGTASGLYNFMNQALSWVGVVLTQFLYYLGLGTIAIFQNMIIIVLCGSIIAVVLFLKSYPKYKNQLEI